MRCETVPLEGGYAIVCGRRASQTKKCLWCSRPAEVLCDHPQPLRKSGTCDLPACREHSRRVGPNRDYCLAHPLPVPEQLPLLEDVR